MTQKIRKSSSPSRFRLAVQPLPGLISLLFLFGVSFAIVVSSNKKQTDFPELDWTLHARGILSTAAEDGVVHTKGGTTLLAVATLASSTRGGSAVHATRVLQRVVLGVAAAKGLVDLVTEYAA